MEQRSGVSDEIIEALGILALHDVCAYVDINGNPVICDWEAYEKTREFEFNKYWLTQEQFEAVKTFLEQRYKGQL